MLHLANNSVAFRFSAPEVVIAPNIKCKVPPWDPAFSSDGYHPTNEASPNKVIYTPSIGVPQEVDAKWLYKKVFCMWISVSTLFTKHLFVAHHETQRMYIGQPVPKLRKNHLAALDSGATFQNVFSKYLAASLPIKKLLQCILKAEIRSSLTTWQSTFLLNLACMTSLPGSAVTK